MFHNKLDRYKSVHNKILSIFADYLKNNVIAVRGKTAINISFEFIDLPVRPGRTDTKAITLLYDLKDEVGRLSHRHRSIIFETQPAYINIMNQIEVVLDDMYRAE